MDLASFLSLLLFRKTIFFQIISELHLEVGQHDNNFEIVPCASRLVLAGDIGWLADYQHFRDFLCSATTSFSVFRGKKALHLADKLQSDPELKGKLTVMNQKRMDLQDVTILGCTFHSHMPPGAEKIIRTKVNDFRRIVRWTVAKHSEEYAKDVKVVGE